MRSAQVTCCLLALAGVMTASAFVAAAETPEHCTIQKSRWSDAERNELEFSYENGECTEHRHCHNGDSNMPWTRWTGIRPEDLLHEGAVLDARLTAEAGEMQCSGTVHGGVLSGDYSFSVHEDFVKKMEAMGFDGLTHDRMQAYIFLDVSSDWVKGLKSARVEGMTSENVIAMRALKVDPEYVRAMADCGYPELRADNLISMRAVGVSPEKVKAVRAMGFSPTREELIQMAVFKIDAPFVERMKAKGFTNPTISQLVKIKIFKLDE